MKRTYETPVVEKVSFNYQEQVAASGDTGDQCIYVWINEGVEKCESGNRFHKPYNNI